jgi:hypothetical protein
MLLGDWAIDDCPGGVLCVYWMVLFHFMLNFTGELFALSGRADQVLFGLWDWS